MIIVCPECSTKFNIKAERLPAAGAKVRCARCKQVFYAENPEQEDVALESPTAEAPEPSAPVTEEAEVEAETSFSYDQFRELDSVDNPEESPTFSSDNELKEHSSAAPAEPAVDEFSFSGEAEATISPITEKVETESSALETEEQLLSDAPLAESELPQQQSPEKKGGAAATIIRILLILILLILVIGGVLVYLNGPEQLNRTIDQLIGKQVEQPVVTGQISLANLEGRFINNNQAGELFLIRGEAINNFSEPRAGIQVKGVIFDPNGKPLLQKTVFCGNPISENELQTLSFAELEKMMGNQFGSELRNMKIEQGLTIPFDIVFKNLPKNLSEFSAKVTSSKPVTK